MSKKKAATITMTMWKSWHCEFVLVVHFLSIKTDYMLGVCWLCDPVVFIEPSRNAFKLVWCDQPVREKLKNKIYAMLTS